MGTGILCLAFASSTQKMFPHQHVMYGGPYVAHLSHDGLLFLAEVVLVVLGDLLVQVLVHLQDLSGTEKRRSGEMRKAYLAATRF